MEPNRSLHTVFKQINTILWAQAERPADNAETRSKRVGIEAERIKAIIAAYTEKQAAMIQALMTEPRFSKFPMPKRRIRLLTRLQARLQLWRAIRDWSYRGRQGGG